MSKLRDKLYRLEKDKIKTKWDNINSQDSASTKEKLEKLVNLSLKRKELKNKRQIQQQEDVLMDTDVDMEAAGPMPQPHEPEKTGAAIVCEYSYPLSTQMGQFQLEDWKHISNRQLTVIFGEEEWDDDMPPQSPMNLLFFDTETTGLAGGTGTIPFMLGFGYFDESAEAFRVKIFILNDLSGEDRFLEEIDRFLGEREFSGTVTYNGKSFDFPLMETRYILQRKRFPLLRLPHLDFLHPARTTWKNTYESRKLGYLGDVLLGLSREDDIDGSRIPMLYFNFLRSKAFSVLEKVVEHNALDLVGMAALVILAAKYQEDISYTRDEGEILGTARLLEKYGDLDGARKLYETLASSGTRQDIVTMAVKGLALLKKKLKLYSEASELWQSVADSGGHRVARELSVHFEHREKNYARALEYVQNALSSIDLTEAQRKDFEKRLGRLRRKISALEKEGLTTAGK